MHIVEVFGRILLSTLFLIEGVKKFFSQDETIMYMEYYGVPEVLFFPALIIEIVFPLLLIIGYKTRFSASVMALFTLTVAIIFHTNFNNRMDKSSILLNYGQNPLVRSRYYKPITNNIRIDIIFSLSAF